MYTISVWPYLCLEEVVRESLWQIVQTLASGGYQWNGKRPGPYAVLVVKTTVEEFLAQTASFRLQKWHDSLDASITQDELERLSPTSIYYWSESLLRR